MIAVLTLFVILIFLLLVVFGVAGFMAWKKVEVFLTWNTRYNSESYEKAVTAVGKIPRPPHLEASKTQQKGRQVKQVPDLVDITQIPFDDAFNAVAEMGEQ